MNNYNTVVGLDVHKDMIVAAVLAPGSDTFALTTKIENQPMQIESFIRRLQPRGRLEFVYEAGPCGYEVHRQISAMGHACTVIAPGLMPRKPGDKVKTDRRDAEKLAKLQRAGELTAVRVPTREEEAARDLTRVREDALTDRLRARHRLGKFLLRQGLVWRETSAWGVRHRVWIRSLRFEFPAQEQSFVAYLRAVEESEARIAALDAQIEELAQTTGFREIVSKLRSLRGIDTLSALTIAVETQDFGRFVSAREFMAFTGLVSREYSSGGSVRRGAITKVGNAHIRRVLVEAAWNYRQGNRTGKALEDRRRDCPPEVLGIARKAQERLTQKFRRMTGRNKPSQVAVVAAARELAGFVWAIGRTCVKAQA
jgi:transposase